MELDGKPLSASPALCNHPLVLKKKAYKVCQKAWTFTYLERYIQLAHMGIDGYLVSNMNIVSTFGMRKITDGPKYPLEVIYSWHVDDINPRCKINATE